MLAEELGQRLAAKGFAIPGMQEVAQQARVERAAAACTYESPCDFDWAGFVGSLALSPAGIGLIVLASYLAGAAAAEEAEEATRSQGASIADDEIEPRSELEVQAARSRARRDVQLRAFAKRLTPLQETFGWNLVDVEGMPTADAWFFFGLAAILQSSLLWLAWPK